MFEEIHEAQVWRDFVLSDPVYRELAGLKEKVWLKLCIGHISNALTDRGEGLVKPSRGRVLCEEKKQCDQSYSTNEKEFLQYDAENRSWASVNNRDSEAWLS